jgi:hypothetical protein
MWEDWQMHDPEFELEEGEDERMARKRQEFESKVNRSGIWEGVEMMGEEGGMDGIEKLWEEEEQDDLLSDLLREIGEHSGN